MRPTTSFKNVELCRAGRWNTGLDEKVITRQHLASAVEAARDPQTDRAPIKLTHTGKLVLGDSLPAAGWVTNLRLSEDGNVLFGDLADVPTRLAEVVPAAFKRRFVEMDLNVTTPAGRKHGAVLTGLALLGAQAPPVESLTDVLSIYASEDDTGVTRTAIIQDDEEDPGWTEEDFRAVGL
ncbi:hypothetical protein [Arthrobacter tecti]